MPFSYPPRVTGSNFEPVSLRVRQDGVALPHLGIAVTINVRDRETRAVIVQDGVAEPGDETGRWDFHFTSEQVDAIATNTIWLIEWTVQVGPYTFRTPEPAQMPVRKRL